MQRDTTALVKAVASVVREQIGKAANALTGRIDALERKFAELPTPKDGRDGIDGKDGRDGIDGKNVSVDDLLPTVKGWFEALPKPQDGGNGKDGRDGADGKSVTVEELRPMVEEFLNGLPLPQNGRDGMDGKSVSVEDVLPTMQKWFEEYATSARQHIESIPAPKDGRDGIDGKSVTVEDVLPLFNQAFDKWALDFERRAQDIHTRLLATFEKPKDGEDGKDGVDGLGFDDIDITHDGERGFTIAVVRGERRKEFTFQLPVVLERGVFKAGHEYCRGDGVTADGSYWIAQKDSPSGRPGQSPDWRLSVKRGRDGKGS